MKPNHIPWQIVEECFRGSRPVQKSRIYDAQAYARIRYGPDHSIPLGVNIFINSMQEHPRPPGPPTDANITMGATEPVSCATIRDSLRRQKQEGTGPTGGED